MTASLLIFPVDREKALRLGARARWEDWPLSELDGHQFQNIREPQGCSPHGVALFDAVAEARIENERLKALLAEGQAPRANSTPRTPCAQLDHTMVVNRGGEQATRREPSFYFGGVHFDDPVIGPDWLKVARGWLLHIYQHWFARRPRWLAIPTLRAQPGLHHVNQSPDFPVCGPTNRADAAGVIHE